jgi:MobA-like NTP transferase domain
MNLLKTELTANKSCPRTGSVYFPRHGRSNDAAHNDHPVSEMKNNSTVCIIIAAGEGARWNNYLGKGKHFIEIDGETIIARTVRLAERFSSRIYVVGNSSDLQVKGSTWFRPQLNPLNYEADKFLSSAPLWNREGRTVVFYGDVYFSENAMQRIMKFQPKEWALFARFGTSKLTGKLYGECFAHSFYSEHIPEHAAALQNIISAYLRGEIKRCGGWEHYRAMEQLPLKRHQRKDRFVEIDDWTEDFDLPLDYDRWLAARYRGFGISRALKNSRDWIYRTLTRKIVKRPAVVSKNFIKL